MKRRWNHPLTLLFAFASMFTLFVLAVEGFSGFSNSLMALMGIGSQEWIAINWPYVLAGSVWLTGFSVGLIGFVVNLCDMFRCGVSVTKDFSLIQELKPDERKELDILLNDNTYELCHLKSLWGEKP